MNSHTLAPDSPRTHLYNNKEVLGWERGGPSRMQRNLFLKRIKSYHLLNYLWIINLS